MIQSRRDHETLDKQSDKPIAQFVLFVLIPFVIVLIWIALMYDRLLANPFLAILLVLGILVILFGGTMRFGPVRIEHKTTETESAERSHGLS